MWLQMNDSIFDNKQTDRIFASLAKKAAKQQQKQTNAAKRFMRETAPDTLREILNTIAENGHPDEQEAVHQLQAKYESKESLDFNDIITLRDLYKSTCCTLRNKDDDNG